MLPRNPTNRHMPMHPYYYRMPPGYYRQGSFQPRMPHMNYRGPAPMRQRQNGGLLAKLLGGQKRGAARNVLGGMTGQNAARGPSILQSLTNPASINNFLTNTQKVLNTAQQIGPIVQQVQQYGPLVKNLPAMWRLYKGLKNVPDAETDGSETHSDEQPVTNEQTEDAASTSDGTETKTSKWKVPSPSVPKMYI